MYPSGTNIVTLMKLRMVYKPKIDTQRYYLRITRSLCILSSRRLHSKSSFEMDSKMMVIFSVFMLMGFTYAAPAPKAEAAFVAPVVAAAPAVVTATSSQVIARNYNGIAAAAPLVAAPAVAPVAAPVFASPYAAYPAYSPYVTYF